MMFKPEVIKQKKGENRRSENSRNTRCYHKTSKKCQGKTITAGAGSRHTQHRQGRTEGHHSVIWAEEWKRAETGARYAFVCVGYGVMCWSLGVEEG